MKILIVGAGVIGVTYGWALSEAGHDVTHFVQHGRQNDFKGSIPLDIIDERKGHKKNHTTQYPLHCVETISPSDRFEIVILPLHFFQVELALQALVPFSGEAIFLDFGSNWNGTDTIDKYLPKERYLFGFPYAGGIIRDGEYVTYLGSKVYLGEADGKHTENLRQVISLFTTAGFKCDIPDNIMHMMWATHSAAIGNAAALAEAGGVEQFLHNRTAMVKSYAIVKELFELCRLRGVDPNRYSDASFLYRIPAWFYVPVLRLFCAYNSGVVRVLTHLADPAGQEEKLYAAMIKTAHELHFDIPRAKAAGRYLQND